MKLASCITLILIGSPFDPLQLFPSTISQLTILNLLYRVPGIESNKIPQRNPSLTPTPRTTLLQQLYKDESKLGIHSTEVENNFETASLSSGISSFTNRLQRFVLQGRTSRNVSRTTEQFHKRSNKMAKRQCRTKLSFRRPDSHAAWDHFCGGSIRSAADYNHGDIGITNPSIEPFSVQCGASDGVFDVLDASLDVSIPIDGESTEKESAPLWWPSSLYGLKSHQGQPSQLKSGAEQNCLNGWRELRYTRRVGKGDECYQRVRNAALDWEFHTDAHNSNNKSMGIFRAVPPPTTRCNSNDQNAFVPLSTETNANVVQIWSSPGKRMLATYAETRLGFRLGKKTIGRCRSPSLYVLNPVAVVYDLIDQRGPGTTFTSTAYGTLGGHWLRGECRVTVAIRDSDETVREVKSGNSMHRRGVSGSGSRIASGRAGAGCNPNSDGSVDIEILSYSRPSTSLLGRLVWPIIGNMQNTFFLNQLDALEDVARDHR